MPVQLKPTSVIKARLGIDPNGSIQKFFVNTCAKHMDKYVPMREGVLRLYQISGNYIIYSAPYAEYQYYGQRYNGTHIVKNYTTPGTGPYWDRRMASAEMSDIINEVQSLIGGN